MHVMECVLSYDQDLPGDINDYLLVADYLNQPHVLQRVNYLLEQASKTMDPEEAYFYAMEALYAEPVWPGAPAELEAKRKAGQLLLIHRVEVTPVTRHPTIPEA